MSQATQPQPKSILKHTQPLAPTSPDHVVWDEDNLAKNEEERIAAGPRMKIEEPKTPYHESLKPDELALDDDFALGGSAHHPPHPHVHVQSPHPTQADLAHANMIHNAASHPPQQDGLTEYQFQHHLGSPPPGDIAPAANNDEESSEEEDDPYEGMDEDEKREKMEQHSKFEQMRKQHYNMKQSMFKKASNPLSQQWQDSDDESD